MPSINRNTEDPMVTFARNIVFNIHRGPRPVPLTTQLDLGVSDPPSVLDWTASWVQQRHPGTAWIDARKIVLATVRQVHEHGEDTLSDTQREVWTVWKVNLSASKAGI